MQSLHRGFPPSVVHNPSPSLLHPGLNFPNHALTPKALIQAPLWERPSLRYLGHCNHNCGYLWPATAKSLQSCPTLCDSIDGSPPSSPVPGILQARTLEWVAISFSNAWKGKVKVKSLSRIRLLATPWTAAYQAPPSMAFSRQEYWSGVPLPSPYLWPSLP